MVLQRRSKPEFKSSKFIRIPHNINILRQSVPNIYKDNAGYTSSLAEYNSGLMVQFLYLDLQRYSILQSRLVKNADEETGNPLLALDRSRTAITLPPPSDNNTASSASRDRTCSASPSDRAVKNRLTHSSAMDPTPIRSSSVIPIFPLALLMNLRQLASVLSIRPAISG